MKIRGIVHIGAHYGEEIQEYINNGIQDIIVFEPLSENFKVLEKNLKDLNANIDGYQIALGSKSERKTMILSSNDQQSSSLLKPKLHLEHHDHVKFEGTEEVDVDLLDNYDIGSSNFINIDVQGYELEVFKGAMNTLKQIDYIYTEVNRGELYENCALIENLDEFLSQYSFKRVETFWPEDWYQWGDALYIKKS